MSRMSIDIFGARSGDGNREPLNSYVGALFAEMRPGSIMVTLDKITCLGRSVKEENENRVRRNIEPNPNASFFEYERKSVGNFAVTWGGDLKEQFVWVYRRIHDGTDSNIGKFLCSKPNCNSGNKFFTMMIPSTGDEDFDFEAQKTGFITLLREHCIYCNEKRMMSVRESRRGWRFSETACPTAEVKKTPVKQRIVGNRKDAEKYSHKRDDVHDVLYEKAYARSSLEIEDDDSESDFSIEVYDAPPFRSNSWEVSKMRKSEDKYKYYENRNSSVHQMKHNSQNKLSRSGRRNDEIVQQKQIEEREEREERNLSLELETAKVWNMNETIGYSKCKSVSTMGSPLSTPNIESSNSSEASVIVGRQKRARDERNGAAAKKLHIYQQPFVAKQYDDIVVGMSLHDSQQVQSIKARFADLKSRRPAHPIHTCKKKHSQLHPVRKKKATPRHEVIEIYDSDDD